MHVSLLLHLELVLVIVLVLQSFLAVIQLCSTVNFSCMLFNCTPTVFQLGVYCADYVLAPLVCLDCAFNLRFL